VAREDEKYTVSHSEEVTCFVLTMDSLHVITGSRDMSLKVWQVAGGKLAQVSQKGGSKKKFKLQKKVVRLISNVWRFTSCMKLYKTVSIFPVPCMNIMEYVII
jgi:WD40 repeat protein